MRSSPAVSTVAGEAPRAGGGIECNLQSPGRRRRASRARQSAGANVDAIAVAGELLSTAPAYRPRERLIVGEIAGASDDQLRSAIDSVKKKIAEATAIMLATAATVSGWKSHVSSPPFPMI